MKKSISLFMQMIIFVLILSSCNSGYFINNQYETADPTQVELARQRLVEQLATDASSNLQIEINTQEAPQPSLGVGSISGTLSYPSEFIPAQEIVAFRQGSSEYYFTSTAQGQGTYLIEKVPPGIYHVIAFVDGMAAGYSQAVTCGLLATCNDHSLIDVIVTAGTLTSNINPNDWYAPPGTFPSKP